MSSYFLAAILAWLPLIALTLSLGLRGKVQWPLVSGIGEPGILCMDGRLKGEGWRLPGGAFSVSFPVFWGTLAVVTFSLRAPEAVTQFAVAAFAFQFTFTQPLEAMALVKIFLHALLGDSEDFPLELHHHICKAVLLVDLLAAVLSPLYFLGERLPGRDVFERVFDAITSVHLIDIVPLIVVGTVVAAGGRGLRKILFRRSSPWLRISIRFSDFHGNGTVH